MRQKVPDTLGIGLNIMLEEAINIKDRIEAEVTSSEDVLVPVSAALLYALAHSYTLAHQYLVNNKLTNSITHSQTIH